MVPQIHTISLICSLVLLVPAIITDSVHIPFIEINEAKSAADDSILNPNLFQSTQKPQCPDVLLCYHTTQLINDVSIQPNKWTRNQKVAIRFSTWSNENVDKKKGQIEKPEGSFGRKQKPEIVTISLYRIESNAGQVDGAKKLNYLNGIPKIRHVGNIVRQYTVLPGWKYEIEFQVPSVWLNPGQYFISFSESDDQMNVHYQNHQGGMNLADLAGLGDEKKDDALQSVFQYPVTIFMPENEGPQSSTEATSYLPNIVMSSMLSNIVKSPESVCSFCRSTKLNYQLCLNQLSSPVPQSSLHAGIRSTPAPMHLLRRNLEPRPSVPPSSSLNVVKTTCIVSKIDKQLSLLELKYLSHYELVTLSEHEKYRLENQFESKLFKPTNANGDHSKSLNRLWSNPQFMHLVIQSFSKRCRHLMVGISEFYGISYDFVKPLGQFCNAFAIHNAGGHETWWDPLQAFLVGLDKVKDVGKMQRVKEKLANSMNLLVEESPESEGQKRLDDDGVLVKFNGGVKMPLHQTVLLHVSGLHKNSEARPQDLKKEVMELWEI
ncbi:hypothetical protein BKA69DRAFT_1102302 [Paraphysoderma sedebokerense]|nr:hypothetical protein BKA69DRAFT_1102302 [Paraphysoderma sedebokerense]